MSEHTPLRIVIADDEADVIKLCRVLIEYPHVEVVGEAGNGLELMDRICELRPDVVITDINMPGMTGLELIEKAKDRYPETHFVIMSGYTDFEYVQTALRYGVWDYLLKPLQKKELNLILEKLDHTIRSEQQDLAEKQELKSSLEKNDAVLKERLFRALWEGGATAGLLQEEQELLLQEQTGFLALCICADPRRVVTGPEMDALLRNAESVFMRVNELAESISAEKSVFRDGRITIYAISYSLEGNNCKIDQFISETEKELARYNNLSGFVRLTGGYSSTSQVSPDLIAQTFQQALSALKCRIELRTETIIRYDEAMSGCAIKLPDPVQTERLRSAITGLNTELACETIEKIWKMQTESIPGASYDRIEEILRVINQAQALMPDAGEMLKEMEVGIEEILYDELTPKNIVAHLQSAVREAERIYHAHLSGKEKSVIEKAKEYVNRNYAQEISLEDVSKYVLLSPAYFSSLFKAETGTGFVRYVQFVRMENAKKLLREGSMRVEDIAREVGYKDVKHFNKVFRQETNVKPSEYRKLYS